MHAYMHAAWELQPHHKHVSDGVVRHGVREAHAEGGRPRLRKAAVVRVIVVALGLPRAPVEAHQVALPRRILCHQADGEAVMDLHNKTSSSGHR